MTHTLRLFPLLGLLGLALFAPSLSAQATGDLRGTVAEPTFPATCSTFKATLQTVNGEPSSELSVSKDTGNLQTALTNCTAGQAVEVVADGSNNAIVISPIAIPPGVTLLVDGGVTIFGSINDADYQNGTASSTNTCGTNDGGTACYPLITLGQTSPLSTTSSTGAITTSYSATQPITGIMGYGIINGRGADKLISSISGSTVTYGQYSAYDLGVLLNNGSTGKEDVPVLIYSYKTANVTLYKITLLNSQHFHIRATGQGNLTGGKYLGNFTVWGIKLLAPWSGKNTDGFDPTGTNNVTVTNSVIGDGDDEVAISGSAASANFTFSNLLLTGGHGLSIGSISYSGVSNVLASNINFSGQAADTNDIALRIKGSCSSTTSGGGAVNNITYNGVCIRNVRLPIELDPYYATATGTTYCPAFGTSSAPITYQNIYIDTPSLTIGGTAYPAYVNLQGLNYSSVTNLSNVTLNNVFYNNSTLSTGTVQSTDTAQQPNSPAYANIALSGSYYPAGWAALGNSANNVTETNNATAATAYPSSYCANAYPTLVGELYANTVTSSTTVNNINKAVTVTVPVTVKLNAMLQPTNSVTGYGAATAAAQPTAGVQFLDGTTVVGTGTLDSSGKFTSVSIANPTAGTHSYTASYIGDSTYPATPFGTATYTGTQNGSVPAPTPLVITVKAGAASQLGYSAAPASAITYGAGPGTVRVVAQDAAGDALTSLTGTVTLTVTGPSSYSATYTATASSGTATFSSIANPPAAGSYTYTASASGSGLTNASATETVAQAVLNVATAAASKLYDQPIPAFTYSITGYQNGDTSSVVSGAPSITTTAVPDSPATTYPIAIAQGTLFAQNYIFALAGNTLTVNGNVPQLILFQSLPNFASGASYQLVANASSGLPVTYTVSGSATVSGSSLNVTAPGQVTVTAAQPGNASYAAAATVQRTFTAQ